MESAGREGKRTRGGIEPWDALSLLFVLLFLVLILVNHSLYPVFLDAPYHMAVTRGFREAGGVSTWDFWDYAPAGRPHLYPPLLHVGMSLLQDLGLSDQVTITLVCMLMFPLLMLALWWAMRGLYGPRVAFFSLVLLAVPGAFLWEAGVTIAASLVMVLAPLVFLALERGRKVAAAVLLAMALYSHLVLGHLLSLALCIYLVHRREQWRRVIAVLGVAYLLYVPWAWLIIGNFSSLGFSEPAAGGGMALHLLVWALAAVGLVACYRRKGSYLLLPSFFLSMVPIAFFYPHRFWQGHALLPLAMLGAVALDGLYIAARGKMERALRSPALSSAAMVTLFCALLLVVLLVDPVLAWGSRPVGAAPSLQANGTAFGNALWLAGEEDGGAGTAIRRLPAALNAGASSTLRLELQPTSLEALLGLEELRTPARGVGTFGPENLELVRVVEEWSEPGDLVHVNDGVLGDFIYAMTGRYVTRGMFHEVHPESGQAAPEEADLVVVHSPAAGARLSRRVPAARLLPLRGWQVVGRAGSYLVLKREAKGAEEEEVKDMGTVIPMWLVYVLAAMAALAVVLDALRRGHPGKGGSGPEDPFAWPPGFGEGEGHKRSDSLVLIPARDEEGNVGKVVSEVREKFPGLDILVLDDGSLDGTCDQALRAGAMVMRSEDQVGLGEMMRLGMTYALREGYRAAVRVDGDGQHAVQYIPSMLWPVLKGEADVVVGSRFTQGGGYEGRVSIPRRAGMAYFRFLLRLWVGRDFSDPTSGFRSYSRRAMSLVAERRAVRYPEVSELHLFSCRDLVIREVPVRMKRRLNGRSSLGAAHALCMFWGATLTSFRFAPRRPRDDRRAREIVFLPATEYRG
ncbi:MAG: glycosyltransferase [Actinobacteria bacterium]|nr:glycosyltransferase [Actinomycetota bacterium]